ncbi:MAG TPA: ABC transporter permease [Christensenellaceae bacterium]|jgi:peptide/nickel transport system permease protein|nr:ABC transporter permease [Christensenellaceae bacterium]
MSDIKRITKKRKFRKDNTLYLLLRDPLGRAGFMGIALIVLLAIFAPYISNFDVAEIHSKDRLQAPNSTYWFGTDNFGRDIFSRIVYGARVSLIVGIVSVSIAAGIGFILGIISGYFEGRIETTIMMVMDVLFAFPSILLALLIVAVLGTSIVNTMIAIGIVNIPVFTRTVRASVKSIKSLDFVADAKSIGLKDRDILIRHIAPNSLASFIVQATLALSSAILTEATMSFLGLGIRPPEPSWGSMLSESRAFMELAPWMVIFPALFIILTILSFNILGDALRDVLDPKLKL